MVGEEGADLARHLAAELAEDDDIWLAFNQFDGDVGGAFATAVQDVPCQDFHAWLDRVG